MQEMSRNSFSWKHKMTIRKKCKTEVEIIVFFVFSRSKDLLLEEEGGILLEMLRLGYFEPIHRTDNDYFY